MLSQLSASLSRRAVFALCALVAAVLSAAFACPDLGIDHAAASALSTASWLLAALAVSALLEDLLHEFLRHGSARLAPV